ncbi:hypothetical protein AXG93_2018s1510 [Marchantia polymorpha subsp. ruderalis]|uniref:Uncharacterized protein n=1 Tax=Marchantia polymorpha subsp. ruderalis TaxID=1480154 RepID=A0A176WDJ8_MARPO|nr:hypothetical protein AXG93_2018s1510 [Marchantia polymorpha subsp. ruderalis]
MAKKKKKSKVKLMVGSTPMDVMKEAGGMDSEAAPAAVHSGGDTMDTSEIVVTDAGPSRKLSMTAGLSGRCDNSPDSNPGTHNSLYWSEFAFVYSVLSVQRVIKKGPQKRKAAKLRKNKALEKAMSMVEKQEQRIMKQELKSYRVQTLKKMDSD